MGIILLGLCACSGIKGGKSKVQSSGYEELQSDTSYEELQSDTSYEELQSETDEYNVTQYTQLDTIYGNYFAPTENGMYFLLKYYIFYLDYKTMKAEPICTKEGCRHYLEKDDKARYDCISDVGSGKFVGVFDGDLYAVKLRAAKRLHRLDGKDFVKFDSSNNSWETVIKDIDLMGYDYGVMHRGVFYFTGTDIREGEDPEAVIYAFSVFSEQKNPEIIYRSGRDYIGTLLPYGNHVYFAPTERMKFNKTYGLKDYDIRTGKVSSITDENDFVLVGACENRLILIKTNEDGINQYYDCDLNTRKISESKNGYAVFAESHPDWRVTPSSFRENECFVSCIYPGESEIKNEDLFLIDQNADVLAVIEGQAHSLYGGVVFEINHHPYYARVTCDQGYVKGDEGYVLQDLPFGLYLFDMEELKSGKNDPIIPVLFENSDVLKDAGLNEMWIDE